MDLGGIFGAIGDIKGKGGNAFFSSKGKENLDMIGSGMTDVLGGVIANKGRTNIDKGVRNQLMASNAAESAISTGLNFIPGVGQAASAIFKGVSGLTKHFRDPAQMENDADVAASSGYEDLTADTDRLNESSAASKEGLFGYRSKQKKYKRLMDELKAKQQKASGILAEGKQDLALSGANAQSLATANRLTEGGFDPSNLRIGRQGMKVIANRVINDKIKTVVDERNTYKINSILDVYDALPDDVLDYIDKLADNNINIEEDPTIMRIKDVMIARKGAKISMKEVKRELGAIVPTFKLGGSINVILDGKLHEERHSLKDLDQFKNVRMSEHGIPLVANIEGEDKDGNPIFAKQGGKIEQFAEFERDEIVFRRSFTAEIEEAVDKYYKDNDKKDASIELGKKLVFEILENTEDSASKLLK